MMWRGKHPYTPLRSRDHGDRAMLVRIATHWADRRDALGIREFTYNKGKKIYGENEPGEDVYQVRTGTVRRYKVLSDGRRQIGAFRLPGDIFGLENGDAFRF